MVRRTIISLVLLVLIGWGIEFALPRGELRDYGSFVASGRAASQGQNPYGIYPLSFHVVLPGFEAWNPNLNPPVSVLAFQVFDRVDPHQGFRMWWSVSFLCYVGAVMLLLRRYGSRRSALLALWAFALAGFWDTLALGQIYLPLVLAAVGAWLLLDGRRDLEAGVLIGVVVAIKPNFAVWPALLLLAGHRRAPISSAATVLVLWSLPLLVHGTNIYAEWVQLVLTDSNRPGFLTNASLVGLFQRVGVGMFGMIVSVALLLALSLWVFYRRPDVLQASALGILGGIAASPIAWVHYTLFLLPVFFTGRMTAPLIIAAALLIVPVPVVLTLLNAPVWQQVTIGSVYNWAVVACLAAIGDRTIRATRTRQQHATSSSSRIRAAPRGSGLSTGWLRSPARTRH